MNNTARSIVIAALFLCWAILLGARAIAAATYASGPGRTYDGGLDHVGYVLPGAAWLCFGAALVLLLLTAYRDAEPPRRD